MSTVRLKNTHAGIRSLQSDMPFLPGQERDVPISLLEPLRGNIGVRSMFRACEPKQGCLEVVGGDFDPRSFFTTQKVVANGQLTNISAAFDAARAGESINAPEAKAPADEPKAPAKAPGKTAASSPAP